MQMFIYIKGFPKSEGISKMNKNYNFFMKTNVDNYTGQWVAVCNQKIISHGKNAKEVFKEAKKACPKERPLLTRVPDKEAMIF